MEFQTMGTEMKDREAWEKIRMVMKIRVKYKLTLGAQKIFFYSLALIEI